MAENGLPVPPSMAYTVEMRCEGGGEEASSIEASSIEDASEQAKELTRDWVRDGDWGEDGASVDAWWALTDDDDNEVKSGSVTVEIEPDHESLVAAATRGDPDRSCGDDPDDHDWTGEGEGGCRENPGVWSLGGTAMSLDRHCRTCGLRRHEHSCGNQRNPGEHDTVSYEFPDSWCGECEHEECSCEKPSKYACVFTSSGYAIRRGDGGLASFKDSNEAAEELESLEKGESSEDDYEWDNE